MYASRERMPVPAEPFEMEQAVASTWRHRIRSYTRGLWQEIQHFSAGVEEKDLCIQSAYYPKSFAEWCEWGED